MHRYLSQQSNLGTLSVVLEPVEYVRVSIPERTLGDVIWDVMFGHGLGTGENYDIVICRIFRGFFAEWPSFFIWNIGCVNRRDASLAKSWKSIV
jgi:hypothetical protein